jgi:hypothetical protein
MAEFKSIKVGDEISHYGTFRPVIGVGSNEGNIVLSIQEDGRIVTRTETPKTNVPVKGE